MIAPRSIWVDFNDVDSAHRTTTLVEFGPDDLTVGETLLAHGDGVTCWAEVLTISAEGVVTLRLDEAAA